MVTTRSAPSIAVLAGIGLTSCGGSDDSSSDTIATPMTSDPEEVEITEEAEITEATVANAPATTLPVRRELAANLRPESDMSTNPLPLVEVHDVGQDRMVNVGNIFPAQRPVLLWMWAPY